MKSTIKNSKTIKIDWNKNQLLKINGNSDLVVLTDGIHDESVFSATVVYANNDNWDVGIHSEGFSKTQFVIFDGLIELKN